MDHDIVKVASDSEARISELAEEVCNIYQEFHHRAEEEYQADAEMAEAHFREAARACLRLRVWPAELVLAAMRLFGYGPRPEDLYSQDVLKWFSRSLFPEVDFERFAGESARCLGS